MKFLVDCVKGLVALSFVFPLIALGMESQAVEAASAGSQNVTGSYKGPAKSYLDVLLLSDNKIKFYLFTCCVGFGKNQGEAWGVAPLIDNVATYRMENCEIKMMFKDDRVNVTQKGSDLDCRFGANVSAEGTYLKRKNRSPVGSSYERQIQFSRGRNSAVEEGVALGPRTLLLRAQAGQQMVIKLNEPEGDGKYVLHVLAPDGQLIGSIENIGSWSGLLPKTGDYSIKIEPVAGNARYSLNVEVQPIH